jgi:hypothetical protein
MQAALDRRPDWPFAGDPLRQARHLAACAGDLPRAALAVVVSPALVDDFLAADAAGRVDARRARQFVDRMQGAMAAAARRIL